MLLCVSTSCVCCSVAYCLCIVLRRMCYCVSRGVCVVVFWFCLCIVLCSACHCVSPGCWCQSPGWWAGLSGWVTQLSEIAVTQILDQTHGQTAFSTRLRSLSPETRWTGEKYHQKRRENKKCCVTGEFTDSYAYTRWEYLEEKTAATWGNWRLRFVRGERRKKDLIAEMKSKKGKLLRLKVDIVCKRA